MNYLSYLLIGRLNNTQVKYNSVIDIVYMHINRNQSFILNIHPQTICEEMSPYFQHQ